MTRHNGKRILSALCTLLPCSVFAKSGGVNYSWGADALASMHDYVVTMMLYVQYIIYAATGAVEKSRALAKYKSRDRSRHINVDRKPRQTSQ